MSVAVTFYDFAKKSNSTKAPGGGAVTAQCALKEPTDILNPVLILSNDPTGNAPQYINYNYCYIAAFSRYYFITSFSVLTGGRVSISCAVDALATYRDKILEQEFYIERCADAAYYNPLIEDYALSTATNITDSSQIKTALKGGYDPTTGFFILRTVCEISGINGIASYALTQSQLGTVLSFMFNEANFGDVISSEVVKSFFNPFQYIIDLKWIPYDYNTFISTLLNQQYVMFGWWQSSIQVPLIDTGHPGCFFYADSINLPSNSYTDWRGYSDKTSCYNLFLPGVGYVNISAQNTYEGLCCRYDLDLTTGEALVKLYTGTLSSGENPTGVLIATYSVNMARSIQIGQLNASLINGAMSVLNSTAVMAMTGGMFGGSGIVNAVQSQLSPQPSINGNAGERYILLRNPDIIASLDQLGTAEYPVTAAGRPCYKNLKLGDLLGFVKCSNASIGLYNHMTQTECNAINNYLNSGMYIE